MNILEQQMIKLLKELKKNHFATDLKMEFEAEGTRLDEAIKLKEIAERVGLGLKVKIGGGEAITDIFNAQILGASGIVAPMIESSYALLKYINAVEKHFSEDLKKNIDFGFNLETLTAYRNLNAILKTKGVKRLTTITLGRVDLVGSMNLTKAEINSEKIFDIAKSLFIILKRNGFKTAIGGGISAEAVPFIERLTYKLLDAFETRKVVFKMPKKIDQEKIKIGIQKAAEFELLWLKNKKRYYSKICHEDDERIIMLEKRKNKN